MSNEHVDNSEHGSKRKALPCWRERATSAPAVLRTREAEWISKSPGGRGLTSLEKAVSTQALTPHSCLEPALWVPPGLQPPPPGPRASPPPTSCPPAHGNACGEPGHSGSARPMLRSSCAPSAAAPCALDTHCHNAATAAGKARPRRAVSSFKDSR